MKNKRKPVKYLPEHIIAEILSRLSIKSVARSRCVSKSWNSLISAPNFSRLRFQNAHQNPKINTHKLLITTPSQLKSFDYQSPSSFGADNLDALDFPFKRRRNCNPQFVGSCNGLVCISLDGYNDMIIWNPSTGLYRNLPAPARSLDSKVYVYGFGYDSVSGDYKVVVLVQTTVDTSSWISAKFAEIFSLRNNSWKRISALVQSGDDDDFDLDFTLWQRGILFNGALHWHVIDSTYAFHLSEEKFYFVPRPAHQAEIDDNLFKNLGVFGDSLSFSSSRGDVVHSMISAKIYALEESWVKFLIAFGEFSKFDIVPLCISKGGELISLNLDTELLRYNVKQKTIESFRISKDWGDECEAIVYVESPISPYCYQEMQ